jgi:hypothetical protein
MPSDHERSQSPDDTAGIYPAEYADRPWLIPGYGSQLKIGKLDFVPASGDTDDDIAKPTASTRTGLDVKNAYLSIVMGKGKVKLAEAEGRSSSAPPLGEKEGTQPTHTTESAPSTPPPVCPECNLPITSTPKKHDTSLAHLCSLPHRLPPHHYPRSSMGLRYLEEQGWDANARIGLGAEGREGITAPIKLKEKKDRLGVGLSPKDVERKVVKKEKKLGAKEARLATEREHRIRQEMLRYMNN